MKKLKKIIFLGIIIAATFYTIKTVHEIKIMLDDMNIDQGYLYWNPQK